ncbi:MAG: hypothetical protein IPO00_09545 [Betaproteobacteria bacterium]|nr:hypothetical protein [Betaproteobacteria bacterium]
MINPNAGAAFLVMALSGCATCPPTTVYKLATANEVSGVSSHTDWENRTVLVIEPDIRLVINTCWENGLCVTASLPEGRRMRFTSNEFVEVDEGSGRVINTHRPSLISYTYSCETRRKEPISCSSSDEPPTTEEVRITSVSNAAHNDWKYRSFMKVFATTAEFVGAADSETRDTIVRGQRNYQMAVFSKGRRGAKPYLVRMPAILIDGKPSALPDIRITEAVEPVCRYRAY